MREAKIHKATLEKKKKMFVIYSRNKIHKMVLINLEIRRLVNILRILIIAFLIISLPTKINSTKANKGKMHKPKNKLRILYKLSNHLCKIYQMIYKYWTKTHNLLILIIYLSTIQINNRTLIISNRTAFLPLQI